MECITLCFLQHTGMANVILSVCPSGRLSNGEEPVNPADRDVLTCRAAEQPDMWNRRRTKR